MGFRVTRRSVLKGSAAVAATAFAEPSRAQAPAAETVTPALIEAARKEGKLVWYAAMDLPVTEQVARECLSLPVYPSLTQGELERIVEAVNTAAAAGA